MKCYICNQTPPIAAIRYYVADAIGICHNCGIGVCAKHSHKETNPKSPLLCIQCAGLNNEDSVAEHDSSGKRERVYTRTMLKNAELSYC